jgi:hypothetical protein
VAIEPCTGWPDRLDDATRAGEYGIVAASTSVEWSLGLRLGQSHDGRLGDLFSAISAGGSL